MHLCMPYDVDVQLWTRTSASSAIAFIQVHNLSRHANVPHCRTQGCPRGRPITYIFQTFSTSEPEKNKCIKVQTNSQSTWRQTRMSTIMLTSPRVNIINSCLLIQIVNNVCLTLIEHYMTCVKQRISNHF